MEHGPADFPHVAQDAGGDAMSDEALEAFLADLPPWPGSPITEEEVLAADARARADFAAGRCVPHEEVAKWLATWGTADFKPMPREWLE